MRAEAHLIRKITLAPQRAKNHLEQKRVESRLRQQLDQQPHRNMMEMIKVDQGGRRPGPT